MTEEERQRTAAAAAAAEVPADTAEPEALAGDASLEDEAPPEIPDLSEVVPRLASKPPPKPSRSSGSMPAVRPGSIPPPPPSARRLSSPDLLASQRVPSIEVLPGPTQRGSGSPEPAGATTSTPPGVRVQSQAPGAPASASQAPALLDPPGSVDDPEEDDEEALPTMVEVEVPSDPNAEAQAAQAAPATARCSAAPGSLSADDAARSGEQTPTGSDSSALAASLAGSAGTTASQAVAPAPVAQEERDAPAAPVAQPERDAPPAPVAQPESDAPAAPVGQPESDAPPAPVAQAESDAPAAPVAQPEPQGSSATFSTRGVTIPDDSVPSSQAPMEVAPPPTSALMAMRIISIGDPEAPPSDELDDVDAEELEDEDLAPQSDRIADDAESSDGRAKPPPPPLRRPKKPPPPRSNADKERAVKEAQLKRKVRPWWEELFGDDFSRAIFSPSRDQISAEVDFIEQSLGVAKGGVVLDLACGSGDHAIELASRGYAVVGYDLSVTMLAQAQEIAQERDQKLNFLQGDMREMAFEETFDGIYCWSSSFGYFEEEKNINVAQRMFKALRPGGTLLLDVANRDYIAEQTPSSVWFEGDSCVCMDDAQVDWITSRLKVKRTVMLDDGRSKECNYSVRLYGLHELGKLLHDVGFAIRNASGQIATPGVFFGPASPNIIVLAQRPKE